jgi:hypothetical protein
MHTSSCFLNFIHFLDEFRLRVAVIEFRQPNTACTGETHPGPEQPGQGAPGLSPADRVKLTVGPRKRIQWKK